MLDDLQPYVGMYVTKQREAKGLTVSEFANRCNNHYRTQKHLEDGHDFKNITIRKVLKFLNVAYPEFREQVLEYKNEVTGAESEKPQSSYIDKVKYSVAATNGLERRRRVMTLIESYSDRTPAYCQNLKNIFDRALLEEGIAPTDFISNHKLVDANQFPSIYSNGMEEFCKSASFGTLVAIFPCEEEYGRFSRNEVSRWADAIRANGQSIICLDSGYQFEELDIEDNLTIIEADHSKAVFKLMSALFNDVMIDVPHSTVHFIVTEAETENDTVRFRKQEYARFLSLITNFIMNYYKTGISERFKLEHQISGDQIKAWLQIRKICDLKGFNFKISKMEKFSRWDRQSACSGTSSFISNNGIDFSNEHICFICENDDVALGVSDGISQTLEKALLTPENISLLGFDGTPEFKSEFAESNINALTYEPNYNNVGDLIQEHVRGNNIGLRILSGNVSGYGHAYR